MCCVRIVCVCASVVCVEMVTQHKVKPSVLSVVFFINIIM